MLGRVWKFVQNSKNRQIISWLGGGMVVVVGGFWVAVVYFFPMHKAPEPGPGNISANCGSLAVGGNVTGVVISQGPITGSDCSMKANRDVSP